MDNKHATRFDVFISMISSEDKQSSRENDWMLSLVEKFTSRVVFIALRNYRKGVN